MADVPQLADLIEGLQALHDLEAAKGRLLSLGRVAIPALQRYLCEGVPEVLYEPRRAAVEVLAALRARDALLAYLGQTRLIADPVARMAEDAVENAAARAVAQWRTPQVFEVLLACSRRGARSGVVEALASFACPEAVPYFLQALEDGLCERAAEQALRQLGRRAEWALLGAVRTPLPSAQDERPTSLRRRRKALELLAELGPSPECWPWLRPLLAASDPGLAVGVARIAAALGDRPDRIAAANRLLALLPAADWYLQGEIEDGLERLYPEAREPVEREIAVRAACPEPVRTADATLRILVGLCRQWAATRRGRTA